MVSVATNDSFVVAKLLPSRLFQTFNNLVVNLSNHVVVQSREFIRGLASCVVSHGEEITEKTLHFDR